MIEKFAIIGGAVSSEFLDLNHTSEFYDPSVPCDSRASLPGSGSELWRTSEFWDTEDR